jgi:hypothetical protein
MEPQVSDLSRLIMGSQGKSDIVERPMGSIAAKVVRKGKTRILSVKRQRIGFRNNPVNFRAVKTQSLFRPFGSCRAESFPDVPRKSFHFHNP